MDSHVYGAWRPRAQAVRDVLLADEASPVRPALRQGEGRLIPLHAAATCLSRSCCCAVHDKGPFTAPHRTLSSSSNTHLADLPISGCSQLLLDPHPAWPCGPFTNTVQACAHAGPALQHQVTRPHSHQLKSHNYLHAARRHTRQYAGTVWVSAATATDTGSGRWHAVTEAGAAALATSC